MKKSIIIAAFSLFSFVAFAQDTRLPKWVAEEGYWVVETNKENRQSNIVYFYNDNKELIYKENIEGIVMKLNKRSVKMKLKKVLEQSLVAWAAQQKMRENEMWVAVLVKKD